MAEQENIDLVKNLFELFGKGDIPSAMDLFAEKVEFQSPVTGSKHKHISWSRIRRNKSEIGAFFQELNEKVQLEEMIVSSFTAQDERVVVEGKNQGMVRSTGKGYKHDWVMTFEIRDGKITKNLHYYDTADLESAF
jgi:ketosteroid isomerase-like protein